MGKCKLKTRRDRQSFAGRAEEKRDGAINATSRAGGVVPSQTAGVLTSGAEATG